MRRRRWRTAVLWIGCTLCVLIAVAFVVSGWWTWGLQIPMPYGPAVAVSSGACDVIITDQWSAVFMVGRDGTSPPPFFSGPWLPCWHSWNHWGASSNHPYIAVPLYAVFLAVAVPTLLAWRYWPQPAKPGHCRCGYDLTGNVSGVCPECGQPFEAKGDAS